MKKITWQRPRTTKIYLHPPYAERLQILWPDFKITNSDIVDSDKHIREHGNGFIVLRGEDMEQVDYKETVFAPVSGGLPIYKVISKGDIELTLEAFSNFERNSTIFARITAKNTKHLPVSDCIGILPRTGCESYMMNEHDTGYTPYYPNVKNWYMLKRTWNGEATVASDDEGTTIRLQNLDGFAAQWVKDGRTRIKFEASDFFKLNFALNAGETASVELSFQAYGDAPAFDFEAEKAATTTAWKEIHNKIKVFPDTDVALYQNAFLHQVTQCMQMLCHYRGSDLVVPRQGDIGRFIWPGEADMVVMMLEHVGLAEYTIGVYDYFFKRWLQEGGEDDGRICSNHQQWGRMNGSVLKMIAHRLLTTKSQDEFEYFRPYMIRIHDWIRRERQKSSTDGISIVQGLFPVGKGCDWDDRAQFWISTDATNVDSILSFADVLDYFHDPLAEEVRKDGEAYLNILKGIFADMYAGHENDEEFVVQHMLGVSFEDSERYPHASMAANLVRFGVVDPYSPVFDQMERFYVRTGRHHETGLLGIMTSCTSVCDEGYFGGYGDVYYTLQYENHWTTAWKMRGDDEKIKKSVLACLQYGMTTEFVTAERYCSTEPWYSPWQPNASGSAVLADMILRMCGEKT